MYAQLIPVLHILFHNRTRTAYLCHYVCSGITGSTRALKRHQTNDSA